MTCNSKSWAKIAFAVVVGLLFATACAAAYAADPVLSPPNADPKKMSVFDGLPWVAITFSAFAVLQVLNLLMTWARGSSARTTKIEDDLRAEVAKVDRKREKDSKEIREAAEADRAVVGQRMEGLNRNLQKVVEVFVRAVNDERVHGYASAVACARRHEEETPADPVLLSIPNLEPLGGS